MPGETRFQRTASVEIELTVEAATFHQSEQAALNAIKKEMPDDELLRARHRSNSMARFSLLSHHGGNVHCARRFRAALSNPC